MGGGSPDAWCSWCYKQSTYKKLMEAHYAGFQRATFLCEACEKPTTTCRAPGCTNMARIDWAFCATHAGEIRSFSDLSATIKDPCEFVELLRRDDKNYRRLLKAGAIGAATALVVVPLGVLAAPAVGGAIGVTVLGLKGAAATSAGLAYVGLGSLATGGMGMAGGTAIISAVGSTLGGTLGGLIANLYLSEVHGFKIRKVRDGMDPALICIDGFLTEGTDKDKNWIEGLGEKYKDRAVYKVQWEAKTLRDLSMNLLVFAGKQGVRRAVMRGAKIAGKIAAKKIGFLGPVNAALVIADLARFPWWVAMYKAGKTGILIAEMISRCENRSFVLIGHSLGARAAVSALQVLGTKDIVDRRSRVIDVHLMGGAIDVAEATDWELPCAALEGKCFNYYSSHDRILRYMYRAAKLGRAKPIGTNPIATNAVTERQLISIDCSNRIKRHSDYHKNMKQILVAS
jgi:hypothetical protein